MLRILLADDQLAIRTITYDHCIKEPDVQSVALAIDGAQAIDLSRLDHLDVAVLDIAMPGVNGIMALTILQQERPSLPVVMFSLSIDANTVRHCLKLGALGVVSKQSAYEELMPAIRAVVAGEQYLCRVARASLDADS